LNWEAPAIVPGLLFHEPLLIDSDAFRKKQPDSFDGEKQYKRDDEKIARHGQKLYCTLLLGVDVGQTWLRLRRYAV
jgi:hypothetical protein